MFEVSDKAGEVIKQYLEGNNGPTSVRITKTTGCSGPSLGMAPDQPQENDEVFNEKGISFVIEKELFKEVKPINIEFVEFPTGAGFMIKSALSKSTGCGGSCCSC
jgi:Fe-S cluster assembly iron-binding protein IscA